MLYKKLSRQFYNQKTLKVAKELLGKFLIHKIGRQKLVGMICETEAYCGLNDLASHASRGRTPRTEIMFDEPGHAYVYLIYGMYYCFNIVTERKDYPAAVLIRAMKPLVNSRGIPFGSVQGLQKASATPLDGPGKVCQYMRIDKKLNGIDLTGSKLWVEDRAVKIKKFAVHCSKRIGVDYAGKYKNKPWRFYI